MMFGTYVASRSVMFDRSSFIAEALYINSPVSPVIAEKNAQQNHASFLCTFSFYKNILKKGRVQCIFAKFYCLILARTITF